MIKIVVSVEPILESQITEDICRLRNENLSDRILEGFDLFAASILRNGFTPDAGNASKGRKKGFEQRFHRGAEEMKDCHVDEEWKFLFLPRIFFKTSM